MYKFITTFFIGFALIALLGLGAEVRAQSTDLDCNQCVDSTDIASQAVTTGRMAPGAVTNNRIANNAVTTNKIGPQAVTTGRLAPQAVTNNRIANNAVTTNKIASAAVTEDKITDGAVTNAKLADKHSLDASDGDPIDAVSVNAFGSVAMTGSLNVASQISVPSIQVEPAGGFSQAGLIEIRNEVPWTRSIIMYDNNSNVVFQVELDGDVVATSFVTVSDQRLKTNIENISEPLEKVMDLRGVMFDWRDDVVANGKDAEQHNIGFLAQEVGEVFPEVVKESYGGTLSVDYSALVPVLVEAMKQQQRQIDKLTTDLKSLSGERQ